MKKHWMLVAVVAAAGCGTTGAPTARPVAPTVAQAESTYRFSGFAVVTEEGEGQGALHLGVRAKGMLSTKEQANPRVASVHGSQFSHMGLIFLGADGKLYAHGRYGTFQPDGDIGGPVIEGWFPAGTFTRPAGGLAKGDAVSYKLTAGLEQIVPGPWGCCGSEHVLFMWKLPLKPVADAPALLKPGA